MALTFKDRVEDTTTTVGAGDITLSNSPPAGFISFDSAFGNGGIEAKRFAYVVRNADDTEWEVGIGYLSTSTNLVRENILQSSNNDSVVSFSTGMKRVSASLSAYQTQRFFGAGRSLLVSRGNFLP